MKAILHNLWNGTASSVAGALTAGLTYASASGDILPPWALLLMGAVSAVLSFIAGPVKQ